jgi:hypothetical protein
MADKELDIRNAGAGKCESFNRAGTVTATAKTIKNAPG